MFNSGNHNTYGYTYQNPVNFIDPNGKQIYFMHGTFVNDIGMSSINMSKVQKLFNNSTSYEYKMMKLSSETNKNEAQTLPNSIEGRMKFAKGLVEFIKTTRKEGESITIFGHSHGGNVGIIATSLLESYYGDEVKINLITLNTPSRNMYRLDTNTEVTHINIYNNDDSIQTAGGTDTKGKGIIGRTAGRIQPGALNIEYKDQFKSSDKSGCGLSGHCGQSDKNVKVWLPKVEKSLKN